MKPMCDDRSWAEAYCAFRQLRYLSHERYGDQIRIAVEEIGERYEVSVRVLVNASAAADSPAGGVNHNTSPPSREDVEGLSRLLTTAQLLYQNAEACAVKHHGADFAEQGLPGWLADAQRVIDHASIILAKSSTAASPTSSPVEPWQDDWQLVPKMPTREMIAACVPMYDAMLPDSEWPFTRNIYHAMLAAAPPSPSVSSGSDEPSPRGSAAIEEGDEGGRT